MEIEKFEIAKLDLEDGDTLAVIFRDSHPTARDLEQFAIEAKKYLPPNCNIVFFDGDVELKIIRRKQEDNPDITLCH